MTSNDLPGADERGIVTIKSPYPFSETVERLRSAFQAHGIKVFISIDQQSEAAAVGLEMPPTMLMVFGNPKSGTPLMLAQPLSGLDLPLKVLVSEAAPGEVLVNFNSTRYLIQRHALPTQLSSNIAPVEHLIASTLSN